MNIKKEIYRKLRHKRVRKKISGTSQQPRLCVNRSLSNFYAQVIDDSEGKTLFGLSTLTKSINEKINKNGGNLNAATVLGEEFAKRAQKKGIKKICFDRGGYLFHGRVKAFAEAARKAGLEF